MMSGIRGKDTKPELVVRRGLHSAGFRYRLHEKSLPGRPDLVFRRHSAVLFVNGCFWHGHDCSIFKWPLSRHEFWRTKIEGNVERDRRALQQLRSAGWRVLTIWECALKGKFKLGPEHVVAVAAEWLRSTDQQAVIRGG
jgi:DNA mismatch endonuclease, patch repair protein